MAAFDKKRDDDSSDDEDLHPLFRKSLDEEREPEFIGALRELQKEAGPEALALECKEKGNVLFKGGPEHYDKARDKYTEALRHIVEAVKIAPTPEMETLEGVVRSNRAAINLAYWRGAKAYVSLGKFEEAAAFCELGLSKADPESKPLQKVLKQAKEGVRAREARKTEAARKREKQRASREQSDFVQEFCEANSLEEHLQAMFPPDGPVAAWDETGSYCNGNLEAFVQMKPVSPYDLASEWPENKLAADFEDDKNQKAAAQSEWALVPLDCPIGDILPLLVIAGCPTFHIVAKGTDFHKDFVVKHSPLVMGTQ
eukprot:g3807.t1